MPKLAPLALVLLLKIGGTPGESKIAATVLIRSTPTQSSAAAVSCTDAASSATESSAFALAFAATILQ